VVVSLLGGALLLVSAVLFIWNLFDLQVRPVQLHSPPGVEYVLPLHPVRRVPAALNGFLLWNALVAVLMLVAFGWPIAQFVARPSPGAIVHYVDRAG
jgi:cytochrome c oxidase subunit I